MPYHFHSPDLTSTAHGKDKLLGLWSYTSCFNVVRASWLASLHHQHCHCLSIVEAQQKACYVSNSLTPGANHPIATTMTHYVEQYIRAGIAAIKDHSFSAEQAADQIAKQCTQCINAAAAPKRDRTTDDDATDTAGLESFLWEFWSSVFEIVQDDASTHDRIVHILAALKSRGADGCEGWRIWGSGTDWLQLPLFGPVSRENMNGGFIEAPLCVIRSGRVPELADHTLFL